MMVKARKDHDKQPVADNAASDMSRFAEASSKLFAEQAAAMAMMTAYGMSVAAQMTGMMLGALRGPATIYISDESRAVEPGSQPTETKPAGKVVELRPRAPKVAETEPAPAPELAKKPAVKVAKQPVKAKAAPAKAAAAKPARETTPASVNTVAPVSPDRDDLKKIPGIGPRLEQELNARGIMRYSDLAALSKAAVKKLDAELELEGRIARDDWAGQAKALSGGKG